MPQNVFVSFDHDDADQVGGFKSLKSNPNHTLEFHDRSLQEPVTDGSGRPIKYPPRDTRSEPVRREIRKRFERSSRLIVLIGRDTHASEWVDWEVRTFFAMKEPLSGKNTWRRIRGMRLKGQENARIPTALLDRRSTKALDWDPEALDSWLDSDLNG